MGGTQTHSNQTNPATAAPSLELSTRGSTVLFLRMWAIAQIVHLWAAGGGMLTTPWAWGTVLAASAVLFRPTSRSFVGAMAAFQVLDYVWEMPFSPDHWVLAMAVNLLLLSVVVRRRADLLDGVASTLPAIRLVLLLAYGLAAIAKHNADFYNPVKSCAGALLSAASGGLVKGIALSTIAVVISVVVETSVPILLALPRARRFGVALAMIFHFGLSASPLFAVVDFTAILFPLFLLFLPNDDIEQIRLRLRDLSGKSQIARDIKRFPVPTVVLAVALIGVVGFAASVVSQASAWVIIEAYLFVVLFATITTIVKGRGVTATPRAFGRIRPAQLVVPLLLVVWGLSPYLGLRTTGVLSMFSNLQTEAAGNHFFMPTIRLAGWQDEIILVSEANDDRVQALADVDAGIPLMALRRYHGENPDLQVTGTIGGETVSFGGDGSPWEELSWWESKFLLFRPFAAGETRFCPIA
ncbi:MAG: hypothetical protein HKN03_11000 [Acidimicrobiales bacterium]|nr:hypothetical protein [Acidimicrobiales bacterium]